MQYINNDIIVFLFGEKWMYHAHNKSRVNQFQYPTVKRAVYYFDHDNLTTKTQIKFQSPVQHDSPITNSNHVQQCLVSEVLSHSRTLFVESDDQILSLFRIYFDLLGFESEIIDCKDRYTSKYIQIKRDGKNYAMVVLDTHLKGVLLENATTKMYEDHVSQRIILVTTTKKQYLPKEMLKSKSIKDGDVLTMPFKLSDLAEKLIH